MEPSDFRVMIIGDTGTSAGEVTRSLCDSPMPRFSVVRCESLFDIPHEALQEFSGVVLALPGHEEGGLPSLVEVKAHIQDLPLVALLPGDDLEMAVRAIRMGADEALLKREANPDAVVRSFRSAMARKRRCVEREGVVHCEERDRESSVMAGFWRGSSVPVTRRMYEQGPLIESSKREFDEFVKAYGEIMDLALERRTFKSKINLTESLCQLGEHLGMLLATPRDVVEVHRTALRRKLEVSTPEKVRVYMEEGRYLLLELMGYWGAYYRNYYMGLSGSSSLRTSHAGPDSVDREDMKT